MPTRHHRYMVTDGNRVAEALDEAEKLWPGESRRQLLDRILELGIGDVGALYRQQAATAGRGMYAHLNADGSLVDELIAERRREAAHDDAPR
jgi:hypothetical protein